MSLKLLFVFGWPIRIGGHFKSALAHIKSLVGTGDSIWAMAPGGSEAQMLHEFENYCESVYELREFPPDGRLPVALGSSEIVEICARHNIDVIHAQDIQAFPSSYKAAIKSRTALVYTRAGGPVNNEFPAREVDSIFYSEELLEGLVKTHHLDPGNTSLIRARIAVDTYKPVKVSDSFKEKYALPKTGKTVFMAIRLHESKKLWIDNILRFAEHIQQKNMDISVVIAGEGPMKQMLKKTAEAINDKAEKTIISFIGPVFDPEELNQLYNHADIVAGHGRGVLEAMACEKATIILGEAGQAEFIREENVADISKYNFSGRHFRHTDKVCSNLAELIAEFVEDDRFLNETGRFSLDYIQKYMASHIGAAQMQKVYRKAMKTKHTNWGYTKWFMKVFTVKMLASLSRRAGAIRKRFLL